MKLNIFDQRFSKIYFFITCVFLLSTGCQKEENFEETKVITNQDTDDLSISLEGDLQVSDFVWEGLNTYYYWQEKVPSLADSKRLNEKDYAQFINNNSKPEAFFNSLKHPDDRFSWIQDDYEELENLLQGVYASNGLEFGLTYACRDCSEVVGYVKYVLENSDASNKNVQRGDFFTGVNGIELNTDNYKDLLFGNELTYILNMGSLAGPSAEISVVVSSTSINEIYQIEIVEEKGISRSLFYQSTTLSESIESLATGLAASINKDTQLSASVTGAIISIVALNTDYVFWVRINDDVSTDSISSYPQDRILVTGSISVTGNRILSNGNNIELTQEEEFKTNPIQISKVLKTSTGNVGYLMYNQFVVGRNSELNQVFGDFKSQGINDLIVDLRYNGGGSVRMCIELASMITGQFTGELFSKEQWNSKLSKYLEDRFGAESLQDNFVDTLTGDSEEPINSLLLDRVFILTTSDSASSSELLINSLSPYIDVFHIGEKTRGKNTASITVYDYIDNEGTKNPDHKYALQPIVLKIANKDNFADYADGLEPDSAINEIVKNLGILGDKNEPLLSTALSLLSGTGKIETLKPSISKELLINDPLLSKIKGMHLDKSWLQNQGK